MQDFAALGVPVSLIVTSHQHCSHDEDVNDEHAIKAEVNVKTVVVSWCPDRLENLWTDRIPRCPGDDCLISDGKSVLKILTECRVDDGLFRLAGYVTGYHRVHGWLCSLTGLHEVKSGEETGSGVRVRGDGEQDDRAGDIDDDVYDHDIHGLAESAVQETASDGWQGDRVCSGTHAARK